MRRVVVLIGAALRLGYVQGKRAQAQYLKGFVLMRGAPEPLENRIYGQESKWNLPPLVRHWRKVGRAQCAPAVAVGTVHIAGQRSSA